MAVRTPDKDAHAHFLAGRVEMMQHLRKYSVPWRQAIERWHMDAASSERRAVQSAFDALTADSQNAPFPSVDILLKEQKLSPSALMSGVDDRMWSEAKRLCTELGADGGGSLRWAHLKSSGDSYATAPLTAPLAPRMPCRPAVFVAMLRMRAGLGMGWPTDATCRCRRRARLTTEHVMKCNAAEVYYTRHSALQKATTALVRSAGALARPEPMLDVRNNDRLDIAVTYGDKRVMMDVTVASTSRADMKKRAVEKIEAGCATESAFKEKTQHYKQRVEAQSRELQIIAFDSAGCPHPSTRTYLERWIKAATIEPDEWGIMTSQHAWRARIARSVLQAQAFAVTALRRSLAGGPE